MNFIISPEEKEWLDRLVELEGGGGKSAYIRRLIRREAVRHGLTSQAAWAMPSPQPDQPHLPLGEDDTRVGLPA